MTEPKILTTVTLVVPDEQQDALREGYRRLVATGPRPDGLLRSELLRAQDGRWQVQTLWRDRAAVLAARSSGARPAALVLAEQVGAQHSHEVLMVEDALQP